MDSLQTKHSKELFEFLIYTLGFSLFCAVAADIELMSAVKARGLFANIIKFLITEVPSWIWIIIYSVICISFLNLLKSGLPDKGEPVGGIVGLLIIYEIISCLLAVIPSDSETIELIAELVNYVGTFLYIFLGFKLSRNYQGGIRTLGIIFIVFSLITFGLEVWAEFNASDLDIVGAILLTLAGMLVMWFPWWYESKLLRAGAQPDDEDDEDDDEDEDEDEDKENEKW